MNLNLSQQNTFKILIILIKSPTIFIILIPGMDDINYMDGCFVWT